MKVVLKNFVHMKQTTEKSCWIACAAMVLKSMYEINTDSGKLIEDYNLSADTIGSPIMLIEKVFGAQHDYKEMPMEEYVLPTLEEIEKEITGQGIAGKPRPLLCCVGKDPVSTRSGRPKGVLDYEDGHWILIVGVDVDNNIITVADPELSAPIDINRDDTIYCNEDDMHVRLYWENTTYFNF